MEMNDLTKDRDEKRHILKEKEEASEKLKKEMHYSERLNRQAQNKKSQKEKALKDKQAERTRMYDDMARWKKDIGDWKEERQVLQREGEEYEKSKEEKVEELRATIRRRQDSLTGLEEVIRVKGLQIKELEEERKNLPGAEDDDESRERDAKDREADLAWEKEERELSSQLIGANEQLRGIHVTIAQNQPNYNSLLARQANNPLMYHANSSGVDFDTTGGQGKAKLAEVGIERAGPIQYLLRRWLPDIGFTVSQRCCLQQSPQYSTYLCCNVEIVVSSSAGKR